MIDIQREFNKLLQDKLLKIVNKSKRAADKVDKLMNFEDKVLPGIGYSQHFGGLLEKQRSSDLDTHSSNTRTNLMDIAKKKATKLALAQRIGSSELQRASLPDSRAFTGLKKAYQGSLTQTEDQFYNDNPLNGIKISGARMMKNMSPDILLKELSPMEKNES